MIQELTLQIYLLKKGWLKSRQSIYRKIKKKGAEGWADMLFNKLLTNDMAGVQEMIKDIIELDIQLKSGVPVSKILDDNK